MMYLTRKGTLLDLLFVNSDGLLGEVIIGGSHGHSDLEVVEFKIFGKMRKNLSAEVVPWIWESRL